MKRLLAIGILAILWGDSSAMGEESTVIRVRLDEPLGTIDPNIFGHFTELTLTSYEGGVWSELLFNRKFGWEDETDKLVVLRTGTAAGWEPIAVATEISLVLDPRQTYSPPYAQRISMSALCDSPAGIQQRGYQTVLRHLDKNRRVEDPFRFKAGDAYRVRLAIKGNAPAVHVALGRSPGDAVAHTVFVPDSGGAWRVFDAELTPKADVEDGRFMIYINEPGTAWVDSVSLCEVARTLDGFRRDAVDLTRTIKPTNLRWPGGCFADDYDWRDGVGPIDKRSDVFNRAWKSHDTNDVGTDEFIRLCRLVNAEPYICVNFGTGTPEEAAAWVEYCNGDASTQWGRVRAESGHPEPHRVKYWGVGNEIYLPSEYGATSGRDYGRRYLEFARAMKKIDSSIRLVAVGCFGLEEDRYAAAVNNETLRELFRYIHGWTEGLVAEAGNEIDLLSIHYYEPNDIKEEVSLDDLNALTVAIAQDFERKLNDLCQTMARHLPSGKAIPIALDEWATWVRGGPILGDDSPPSDGNRALLGLEGVSDNLRQAVAEAGIVNLMQRRPNDFALGNRTLLYAYSAGAVGIRRDAVAVSPCGLMMGLFATREVCRALQVEVESDTYQVRPFRPDFERSFADPVPYLDASARLRPDNRTLEVFVVNRHLSQDIPSAVEWTVPAAPQAEVAVLAAAGLYARNAFADPDNVAVKKQVLETDSMRLAFTFPRHSVTRITVTLAQQEGAAQ